MSEEYDLKKRRVLLIFLNPISECFFHSRGDFSAKVAFFIQYNFAELKHDFVRKLDVQTCHILVSRFKVFIPYYLTSLYLQHHVIKYK